MRSKDTKSAVLILGLTGIFISQSADAFKLISRWQQPATTFVVDIAGGASSPSGVTWNEAFFEAAADWTGRSNFTFDVVNQYADPCEEVFASNGVDYRGDICGFSFGENTLGVTLLFFNDLDSTIKEADIIFNTAFAWDVYDGPLNESVIDFRRVALHELGHALGLDHEIELPAIMFPFIEDTDDLQQDDINGVSALYPVVTETDNDPLPNGNPVPEGSPIASLFLQTGSLNIPVAFADDGRAYALALSEVSGSEPKAYTLESMQQLSWVIENLSFSGSIAPTAQVGGSVTLQGSLASVPTPALAARLSSLGRELTTYRIEPRLVSGRIGFAFTAGADFPSGTATLQVRLVNYPDDPLAQDPWDFPVSNTLQQSVFVQ
ncbi:MAG: matrixin family metalloprotease [Chromatiales bacterium]|nr:matrixin family metalloprotease [Chromatiales bacterium]